MPFRGVARTVGFVLGAVLLFSALFLGTRAIKKRRDADWLLARAVQASETGDEKAALEWFARARKAFDLRIKEQQNPTAAWIGSCRLELLRMEFELGKGRPADAHRDRALGSCAAALGQEPRNREAHLLMAHVHARWAEALQGRGEDAAIALLNAETSFRKAREGEVPPRESSEKPAP